ncbi:MAG: murein biosynthesis integral membrane protein MurJ [Caulobacteraceae bacterium]
MGKLKEESIKKATLIMMSTILLSRLLGFVREMLIASMFGRSYVTDAFFAAFSIPDLMFYLLVGGALNSGFMPVFNTEKAKGNEEGAWKAASTFLTVSILFIIAFNIFGIVFAPWLMPLVANGIGKNPVTFALAVKLTRIMFTAVSFTVLAGLLGGILNSYKIFSIPSLGPVLYNVGIIAGAVLLSKSFGIYGLAVGVVIGALANFGIMVPSFRKVGKMFRFRLDIHDPLYQRMLLLMGPAMVGLSFSQVNLVVNQNIASMLSEGTITALRYANRIILLPLGIFASSVAIAIFPTLNSLIGQNEMEKYKNTLFKGLQSILFITIPSSIGLIVLNVPIVRLLFRTGKFTESDVAITAYALAFYSIGVIGQSAVQVVTRAYYSLQDTMTPVKVGGAMVLANLILNLAFLKVSNLAIGGIALSYTITSILNVVILYRILEKKLNGLNTSGIMVSIIKSSAASAVMGVAAYFTTHYIEAALGTASKLMQLIEVGSGIAVGALVFFAVAYLLKMQEMSYAMDMVMKKFKKSAA